MKIRKYSPNDCDEIIELFINTVHSVNIRDYTEEQCSAWTSGVDRKKWAHSLQEHTTFVAVEADQILGFADMDANGYLDRLYVHQGWQRKGIATALLNEFRKVYRGKIITHASITAKPFFEKNGFYVIQEQHVKRCGIFLTNFVMESIFE